MSRTSFQRLTGQNLPDFVVQAGVSGLVISSLLLTVPTDAVAQWHFHASEAAGNYSSIFWFASVRNRLIENGRNVHTETRTSVSTMGFLSTALLPISEELALGMEIPYYVRSSSGDRSYTGYGFGDLSLTTRYTFRVYEEIRLWSRDYLLKARVSLVGKIKLPTAKHDAVDSQGARLPHDMQLGTGSTDASVGFAFLTETEKYFMIHGHLMYQVNTRAHDFKEGNALDYELRYIFVRIPVSIFYPSLGVRGTSAARSETGTGIVNNSGGHVLFLSPGIETLWEYVDFARMFFKVELTAQFPVVQTLHGTQLGYGYTVNGGVRIYFR